MAIVNHGMKATDVQSLILEMATAATKAVDQRGLFTASVICTPHSSFVTHFVLHRVIIRWLLLDEINLAPSEVLERIAGILEDGANGSVTLVERGDSSQVSAGGGAGGLVRGRGWGQSQVSGVVAQRGHNT